MKQDVKCPYSKRGVCYRKRGCIYIPHLKCMSVKEFKKRMNNYVKYKSPVKPLKKGEKRK